MGPCYKVCDEPRRIFLRILSLHSLSDWWEERESQQGPHQLTTIFLKTTGQVIYPTYDVIRQRQIFKDRSHVLDLERVCAIETRVSDAFDAKDYALAWKVAEDEALPCFMKNEALDAHAARLPSFLRKFTSGSVLAYVLTKAVDVCEKLRRYDAAVGLLQTLLAQTVYLNDYRGHWRERLALDLDQHLGRPQEALEAVEAGLADPEVREARRLALCQRAQKIWGQKKNAATKEAWERRFRGLNGWLDPCEPRRQDVVSGKLMPKENLAGAKTVFHLRDANGDHVLCSVEELVRERYRDDFPQGLHAEGAVVNTLCAILFWDVLYDTSVADAFRNPYQVGTLLLRATATACSPVKAVNGALWPKRIAMSEF